MTWKQMLVGLLVLAAIGMLTGCGGAATATPTDVPVVAQDVADTVVAEAVIEPAEWNDVRFDIPGVVAEVLVQEGDTVAAGEPLAQLGSASLERAVAQVQTNLRQAQIALEQLQEPPEGADVRRAENAVSQAAAALNTAQLNLQAVQNSPLFNESLEDAQRAYDEAKERYDISLERYNRGEIDYWYVDHDQQLYEDAALALERVQQQGNAQQTAARNEVTRAAQAYQEAQDALAQLQEGADALAVESAEVAVQAAQVALDEAQSNVEKAVLEAPFVGTVMVVNVKVGDVVAAGQRGSWWRR